MYLATAIIIVLQRMLTKAQNKYIRSLSQQKFRYENKVFIVEGEKMTKEWLSSKAVIYTIAATEQWAKANETTIAQHPEAELCIVKPTEMEGLTALNTPSEALLVVAMPAVKPPPVGEYWYLLLDRIQDPGNMGTIIRIADWFGIGHVVCSPGCVDVYNPKVVQSAMGGHLRVQIWEADLADFIMQLSVPVYAATLVGNNLYTMPRAVAGALIIGNESKGIAQNIVSLATQQVTIPAYGGAESLNAGVATGILCAYLVAG